ncbi:hypothetical protein IWQ56_001748 [Coemansia nantahalensis]|uniref:Uncharacterized protein n=1 Tax=Coemansia nantahalensis TaxID=2789366 RepID=A0ACC1JYP3_9FUNG|nr:hypothetical protein IWQ57_002908 [Coemansia nantahalensis]KAJ2771533.1 hypothetical protein IWQ56_001748 [Coemansia nantahalensis]
MQVFAAVLAIAAVAAAQTIGSDGGSVESSGNTSLNHSNKNTGEQTTNSLEKSGNSGNNKFNNLNGNTFSTSAKNSGTSDSSFTNPSDTTTKGNTGKTANGDDNTLKRRIVPGVSAFRVRAPLL